MRPTKCSSAPVRLGTPETAAPWRYSWCLPRSARLQGQQGQPQECGAAGCPLSVDLRHVQTSPVSSRASGASGPSSAERSWKPPRKHHLVPASYLQRWAEDGQVCVTFVDEARSYLSSPETAARQTDFYRLQHPDLDPVEVPPLLFETMLSQIEGSAKTVIDELLEHFEPGQVDPEQLALFAWHLAMSITRGAVFRAEQQELLSDMYRLQWAT